MLKIKWDNISKVGFPSLSLIGILGLIPCHEGLFCALQDVYIPGPYLLHASKHLFPTMWQLTRLLDIAKCPSPEGQKCLWLRSTVPMHLEQCLAHAESQYILAFIIFMKKSYTERPRILTLSLTIRLWDLIWGRLMNLCIPCFFSFLKQYWLSHIAYLDLT